MGEVPGELLLGRWAEEPPPPLGARGGGGLGAGALATWWMLALIVTLAHHVPVGLATGLRAWREAGQQAALVSQKEAAGTTAAAAGRGGVTTAARGEALAEAVHLMGIDVDSQELAAMEELLEGDLSSPVQGRTSARAPSQRACRRRAVATPPSSPDRAERGAVSPPREKRESEDVWNPKGGSSLHSTGSAILTSRKRKFEKAAWAPRWLLAFTAANGHLTAVGLNIQCTYYIFSLAEYSGLVMPRWWSRNQHLHLSFHVSSLILWLWWSLHFFSPWLIMPKEEFPDGKQGEKIVADLIGLGLPSDRRLVPFWLLLHLQHTGQFILIWVSTIMDRNLCLPPLGRDVCVSAAFAVLYVLWGTFRWSVACRPAYPILEKLNAISVWVLVLFYGMTTLTSVSVALIDRAWEFGIMGKGMCAVLPVAR